MTSFRSNRNMMILLLLYFLVSSELGVDGLSYDYSFTPECLANPIKPQYEGGIVVNPELNEGLKGWSTFLGGAKLSERKSKDGNNFIVAFERNATYHSPSQIFNLDKGMFYAVSVWLRLSHGESQVGAVFKTSAGFEHAGSVVARSGCWSMLKGGVSVTMSGPAQLYFDSDDPTVEIWADSISLQPFTEDEWKSHRDRSIENARKSDVRFQAVDSRGQPLPNAKVSIKQLGNNFPFGCTISSYILQNQDYQNWFTSRFRYTVFENEMKWYSTEKSPGAEDYSVPDAMLRFAKQHNIQVRGHNVFWDDPNYNPSWVRGLSPDQISLDLFDRRITSVMERYKGQLIHWDVVNENIHNDFLEEKLGDETVSTMYYQIANEIDGLAIPFLNEYNTIEQPGDKVSSPSSYLQKIRQMWEQGYNGPLGIGLEGHFAVPNLPYVRAALDTLASAGLPIWITELDVSKRSNQATYLEEIIREIHAHPAVNGILIWSALSPQGCYRMCLTDMNFKNLPTGDVVDKIISELTHQGLVGTTDVHGVFKTPLFHGQYEVQISHPAMKNSSAVHRFKVASAANVKAMKVKLNTMHV